MTTAPIGREERTRQVILDAAAPLLASEPDASMAQIADAAGVGRATLYRHYEGREALVRDLFHRATDKAGAALEAARLPSVPVDEAIRRVFRVLVHVGHRFVIVLRENRVQEDEALRSTVGVRLIALVERGRADGTLREDVPIQWILSSLGALIGFACELADEAGPEDAAAFAADLFLDGVCRGFAHPPAGG